MNGLTGKQVVVTRASHQAGELEQLLRERRAVPLHYPCIDIVPPEDSTALDNALGAAREGAFDWLVLTSSNTVLALKQRLNVEDAGNILGRLRVAAIGDATAQAACEHLNITVSVVPEEFTSQSLAQALNLVSGTRVLLPQSAIADAELATKLSQRGAEVITVTAYRTVIGSGGVHLAALLEAHQIDAITFTSASTVTYFVQRLEAEGGNFALLKGVCLACIGPKTAAAARELNLPETITAADHTLEGLIGTLERHFAGITTGEGERC